MKRLFSSLIAMVALVALAQMATAAGASKSAFPSWSSQINTTKRFTVLTAFGGAAVLDNETGRVWDQSPDTNSRTWFNALSHCYEREIGGRKGWRLPSIEELTSLVDPSVPFLLAPTLPAGHPFSNMQSFFFWSATTRAEFTDAAWVVRFDDGDVHLFDKTDDRFVWCVRGGKGIDGVQ